MKAIDFGVKFSVQINGMEDGEGTEHDSHPPSIDVSIKSDLMESRELASPINSERCLMSVTHPLAGLLVFSIGTDGRLYLLQKNQGESGAWHPQNIGKTLLALPENGADSRIQAFTLLPGEGENSNIAILCSVEKKENPGACRFWLAQKLNIEDAEDTQWVPAGQATHFRAEFMVMSRLPGSVSATDEEFIAIACGKKTGENFISALSGRPGANVRWKELQIGADLESIVDLKFGATMLGGFGFYVLGIYGNRRPFYFISCDLDAGSVRSVMSSSDYSNFKNISAFEVDTVPDGKFKGCSDLYFVDSDNDFPAQNIVKYVKAASQSFGAVKKFETLSKRFNEKARRLFLTRDTAGKSSLYIHAIDKVTGVGTISYTSREPLKENPKASWTPLFTLEQDVEVLSPAASARGRISELFILGKASANIRYLWQDEKTTAWKREGMMVASPKNVIKTSCWHTQIRFSDTTTSCPIDFRKFKDAGPVTIEASESCNVEINHKKYAMEASKPVYLKPEELSGGLNLISNITALGAPLFRIQAPFMPNGIPDIDPAAKCKQTFANLSVDQLKNPRDRYGDPLNIKLVEGEKADPEYLNGIVPGIRQMASFTRKKEGLTAPMRFTGISDAQSMEREGVRFVAPNTTFGTELELSDLPDGVLFCIDFSGETPLYLDAEACRLQGIYGVDQGAVIEGFWDDLARFFGNFIEAIKNTLDKVISFVVEKVQEGIAFIIKIAGETISCLVRFVEQVLVTIDMVLKKYLGIDLSKIMPWLAFIFNAKDIKAMQQYTKDQVNSGFDSLKKQLGQLNENLKKELQVMDEYLKNCSLPEQLKNKNMIELRNNAKKNAEAGKEKEIESRREYMNNDPGMNWLPYHLGDPLSLIMDSLFPKLDIGEKIIKQLEYFMNDTLKPMYNDIKPKIDEIIELITKILKNESDMTLDVIFKELSILFARIGIGLAGKLAGAIMSVVGELLEVAQKLLNAELDIPILSFLYKELIGDDLTMLNAISFMVAIPATILCKVVTGKAPITGNEETGEGKPLEITEAMFWINVAGVWCINTVQTVFRYLAVAANLVGSAVMGKILSGMNFIMQTFLVIWQYVWFLVYGKDLPDNEKWVLVTLHVIQSLDWLMDGINTVSQIEGTYPKEVIQGMAIIRSFISGILFGLAYMIQLILRVVFEYDNARKIAVSTLFFLHQECRVLVNILLACGNIIPAIPPGPPLILKALLQSAGLKLSDIAWWVHSSRAVTEIVFRYAPKALDSGESTSAPEGNFQWIPLPAC